MNEGKTKSFTPEQKVEVDKVLSNLLRHIEVTLKSESERIKLLDNRPRQVWSEEQPDVFSYQRKARSSEQPDVFFHHVFIHYIGQGMLEDLIAELQARV